jgi:hypothetical protein
MLMPLVTGVHIEGFKVSAQNRSKLPAFVGQERVRLGGLKKRLK